ncbi:OmpH family outer membrane protein [Fusobacterium perfoetens]|uniref:OmpH family outer membrane protein n=1 Tax=Fusobacterium perfoetens TaxID=852 RepID=UPI000485AF68|nr:OmpH family outer membrane protein [Fusobacterium perfoetens]MCI6153414.1 OmpH family outer membrane protein [Fusobacterium perfoetens]MDY3238443.1 OmpH family outer membrane protein [Fusobacterium perfoetens]
MKKIALVALAVAMSTQALALKIGVVNSQELFYKYSKTKTMEENLKKQTASLDNTLKQKQVEIQKMELELKAKGNKATDKDKKAFEDKIKLLEKFVKDSQIKLNKERSTRMAEIEKTMNNAINKIAKAEKADYVLEAGAVKFGGVDLTDKVLAEMEKTK